MTVQRVNSPDDPRLAAYRNLPERTLRGEHIFIAEGRLLVHRLFDSHFAVESIFIAPKYLDEFLPRAEAAGIPVYLGLEPLLSEVIGYQFHLGALAVGKRRASNELADKEQFERIFEKDRVRLIGCPNTKTGENLGMVFRSAAALGMDGLLTSSQGTDPFSRRCLRTSMGSVLTLPFMRAGNFVQALIDLRENYGFQVIGTALDESAELLWEVKWPSKTLVLFGNEYSGLTPDILQECDRRVTIPMHNQTDSLNLAVSAGIVMYEMGRDITAGGQSPNTWASSILPPASPESL